MTEPLIPDAPKTDFYLKLASEADMPTALATFYKQDYTITQDPETGEETRVPEGDPYLVKNSRDYALDVVGILYETTGNTITDGDFEYPEQVPMDGWHVNIRLSGDARRADVEALDTAYGVTPAQPRRIWA